MSKKRKYKRILERASPEETKETWMWYNPEDREFDNRIFIFVSLVDGRVKSFTVDWHLGGTLTKEDVRMMVELIRKYEPDYLKEKTTNAKKEK